MQNGQATRPFQPSVHCWCEHFPHRKQHVFAHTHTQKMLSRHEDLPPNYDHQKMERMSHEASNICLIQNILYGYGSIPINTSFSGMNIHKSQLF